ncbi:hypothetical protein Bpfe_013270 [Biomphalaria pfeifferi]|uniref:Uncharacterized protein n=1 Tax=Biomphalaria pfeifferi TaxID=112525 RepID=A0AAD8BM50_BIOPF|nr:hypothetical protein Bpfe_013270 [Biomphalaria pfeifferi]
MNNNNNNSFNIISDIINRIQSNDIDVHPAGNNDNSDIIDRRSKNRSGSDDLTSMNIKLKSPERSSLELVDELFFLQSSNLKESKFPEIFKADVVVLVNLEDWLIFQSLKPSGIQEKVYFIGFVGECKEYRYLDKQFYERFASYKKLRERNAVQIVTHDGSRDNATTELLRLTFQRIDAQLEVSTKIIIASNRDEVLTDCTVTNERGRLLQLIQPRKILARGPNVNIGAYFQ